jgi:hypothetical protein
MKSYHLPRPPRLLHLWNLLRAADDSARKFEPREEICLSGIEVGVDRNEHCVRIALCKLNIRRRDFDHMRPKRIAAGLCR